MQSKVKDLHQNAIVVDGHNHMMMQIYQRRYKNERRVFSNTYAPLFRKGGVNVLLTNVGGDNFGLTDNTDLLLIGTLSILDMILEEAEESSDTMAVCRSSKEIDAALKEKKIAVLLTIEGGRPLETRPHRPSLSLLRIFYRLGLRAIQLVDNGRNRLCDGKGESRTRGGLTNFGVSVVKEMNRLGMLIDVAHINEQGFWDVIEISESPIIDSHSNAMAICDHPRNLKDEQIKAIAQKGGVIGLTCNSAMTSKENDYPTVEDLMKHLGHMIDIAGIDHVGLGPDLIEPHPGPPTESPGYLEGIQYVVRKSHYIEGVSDVSGMPLITEALLKRGYKDQDIRKILGENFLRVYKQVIC